MSAETSTPLPMLLAFSLTVALALGVSWVALIIRSRLARRGQQDVESPTQVHATLFKDKLKYVTNGPVAEFIAVFGTITFVILLFWVLLTR